MKLARLESLQVARGIAASLVFFMHLLSMTAVYSGVPLIATMATWSTYIGNFGVDLFFVLSGFVIAMTATKASSLPTKNAVDFLTKRAARIYPLFWMTMIAALIFPVPGSKNSIDTILNNPWGLLLLGTGTTHPLAWSLVFEMQFYIVAAVLILFGARSRTMFITWAIAQVGIIFAANNGWLPKLPITNGLTLEFSIGVLIGLLVPRNAIRHPAVMVCVGFAIVAVASIYFGPNAIATNTLLRSTVWGLPAGLIIMSLVSMEERGVRFRGILRSLGDESYSIYMWHLMILVAVNQLLTPLFEERGNSFVIIYVGLAVICTLGISRISYRLVEKPVLRMVTDSSPRMRLDTVSPVDPSNRADG